MPTIDEYLEHARSRLDRMNAEDLDSEIAAGALVIDIRPIDQRRQDGEVEGAVVIPRNVLEWRLAPSSHSRQFDIQHGQRVIVMCDEGYQSSVAAATLKDLGVETATDLVGGYQAYRALRSQG